MLEAVGRGLLDDTVAAHMRALGTTMTVSNGLGLGLHIASEFVRAHGGTIEAESTEESGTVFSVRLPKLSR